MSVLVDIVIVNWNTGPLLRECLESIVVDERGFTLDRVIVVDNASSDRSLDGLDKIGLPLILIRNSENRGFAAACNQGARDSRADYLLFLNPDTRLFADSLSVPLAFLEAPQNKTVGICGIQLVDDSGNVSRSCARFPTPGRLCAWMLGLDRIFPRFFRSHLMQEWRHDTSMHVDQVIGAFFMVRRWLYDHLGGFDERFFVYQEEVDFSLRAQQLGWRSYYLAEAKAYHKGGASSGQVKAKRLFYALRSRILYAYKHFGRIQATVVLLGTLMLEPFTRVLQNLLSFSFRSVGETLTAYSMLYKELPTLISRAWKE